MFHPLSRQSYFISNIELIEAVAKKTGASQKWKLIPDSDHEFCPRDPRRVVQAGLFSRIAAVTGGMRVGLLVNVPFSPSPSRRSNLFKFPGFVKEAGIEYFF